MKKITITMNEWQKELAKLPVAVHGIPARQFTKEQDDQIFYANKNKVRWQDFVSWFNKKYGFGKSSTLQRRLRILKDQRK